MEHEKVIKIIEEKVENVEKVISEHGKSEYAHGCDYYTRGFIDAMHLAGNVSENEARFYIDKLKELFK